VNDLSLQYYVVSFINELLFAVIIEHSHTTMSLELVISVF